MNQDMAADETTAFFDENPALIYLMPVLPSTAYRLRLGFPTHWCNIESYCGMNILVDGKPAVQYIDLYVINPKHTAPYLLDLPGKPRVPAPV